MQTSAAATPATSSAGLVNDWLREQAIAWTNWDIGGQIRTRFEHKEHVTVIGTSGAVDFRDVDNNDNTYFLLREKLHVGYTPCSWATAYVEGRDASAFEDRRNPSPDIDHADLYQAYLRAGDLNQFPLELKIGRQELAYGDERLIGTSGWSNLERIFDAARLRYQKGNLRVDLFSGNVVLADKSHFDEPNRHDWFSGIYVTSGICPGQTTEAYLLARNVDSHSVGEITTTTPAGGPTARDVYTIGARVKSLPNQFGPWDYECEAAGQWGDFALTPGGTRLEHRAFAAHALAGYTFREAFGAPRVVLEYNYASGDSNTNDNSHETFDNLFPTNHKFYGFMDFFSWQNVHELRLGSSMKPWKKFNLSLDYHAFWLADTHDYFYQVNGTPRRTGGYGINPDAGNYTGSEVDLVGTFTASTSFNAQVGYGHFFVGDYVRNSLGSSGTADSNFVYAQLLFSF